MAILTSVKSQYSWTSDGHSGYQLLCLIPCHRKHTQSQEAWLLYTQSQYIQLSYPASHIDWVGHNIFCGMIQNSYVMLSCGMPMNIPLVTYIYKHTGTFHGIPLKCMHTLCIYYTYCNDVRPNILTLEIYCQTLPGIIVSSRYQYLRRVVL